MRWKSGTGNAQPPVFCCAESDGRSERWEKGAITVVPLERLTTPSGVLHCTPLELGWSSELEEWRRTRQPQMNAVLGIIVSTLTRSATSRGGLGGGLDPSTSRCFSPPQLLTAFLSKSNPSHEPFLVLVRCAKHKTFFLARRSPS
jgi:hypothetical protein